MPNMLKRYTKDLDIWINNSRENATRVYHALKTFGAPLDNITIEDFTVPSLVFQMGIEPSRIDILMGLKELSFDDCWQRKATATVGGAEIYFIGGLRIVRLRQKPARQQGRFFLAERRPC